MVPQAGKVRALEAAARAAAGKLATWAWPEPLRAASSVLLGCLAGSWLVLLHPSAARPLGLLAGCAVALLVAGVVSKRVLVVAFGVLVMGAGFLGAVEGRPFSPVLAAGFGSLLLAVTELAWWSAELAVRTSWPAGLVRRRWALLGATCLAGFCCAFVAGLLAAAAYGAAPVLAPLGGVAAICLGLVLRRWFLALGSR